MSAESEWADIRAQLDQPGSEHARPCSSRGRTAGRSGANTSVVRAGRAPCPPGVSISGAIPPGTVVDLLAAASLASPALRQAAAERVDQAAAAPWTTFYSADSPAAPSTVTATSTHNDNSSFVKVVVLPARVILPPFLLRSCHPLLSCCLTDGPCSGSPFGWNVFSFASWGVFSSQKVFTPCRSHSPVWRTALFAGFVALLSR